MEDNIFNPLTGYNGEDIHVIRNSVNLDLKGFFNDNYVCEFLPQIWGSDRVVTPTLPSNTVFPAYHHSNTTTFQNPDITNPYVITIDGISINTVTGIISAGASTGTFLKVSDGNGPATGTYSVNNILLKVNVFFSGVRCFT